MKKITNSIINGNGRPLKYTRAYKLEDTTKSGQPTEEISSAECTPFCEMKKAVHLKSSRGSCLAAKKENKLSAI